MILIREAEHSDLTEVLALAIHIFTTTFEKDNNPEDFKQYMDEAFTKEKFEQEFLEVGTRFFIAQESEGGKRIVGYARIRKSDEVIELLGDSTIELQRLYIDIPWQGQGIANRLLAVCEEFARANFGVEWMWLGVWEHNPKAQKFYQKYGYQKFSEHTFLVGSDAQTDWLMKKKIR